MAENSNIAWTTHTFNPWIGCTKVSPGCDHCYAEAWDRRFDPGHVARHWGHGSQRRRTSGTNWRKVRVWQRDHRAAIDRGENPESIRVFCASLADVFDNEVDYAWRLDLWTLIASCPDLEWILVTKRVGNIAKMAPAGGFCPNVIILATIVDQTEADRDMPKLVSIKKNATAQWVGVSYEPALGPVDWSPWLADLDWLIIGGESAQGGASARPFGIEWARSSVTQCRNALVPVFVKQLGSTLVVLDWPAMPFPRDRAGADPDEWPHDLRIREFPIMQRP